jgi:hypothetical protein
MIPLAFIVCSLGMAGAAIILLYRLRRLKKAVVAAFQGSAAPDGLRHKLAELIQRTIDATLLAGTGKAGLADIDVPCREFNDPYRNLDELLGQLRKTINSPLSADVNQQIKYVFQIQSSLGIQFSGIHGVLRILESRLRAGAGSAAAIEIVAPGMLLDAKKMLAINNGTHVKQPLGVVVLDAAGRILSKARVVCE